VAGGADQITALYWLGGVAGLTGTLLIALNAGATIVGLGFVVIAIAAGALLLAAWRRGRMTATGLNAALIAIALIGAWRWLVG